MEVVSGVHEATATPQVGHRPVPGSRVSPHVEQRMVFGLREKVGASDLDPYGISGKKIHDRYSIRTTRRRRPMAFSGGWPLGPVAPSASPPDTGGVMMRKSGAEDQREPSWTKEEVPKERGLKG